MVSERDRILVVIRYLEGLNIKVNIAKNKARGNKGFFKSQGDSFRIDISKGLDDAAILSTLVHEYAHYIHYQYDKSLKALGFLTTNFTDVMQEELLNLTVLSIPKESIKPFFLQKESLEQDIKTLERSIMLLHPDLNFKNICESIESKIKKRPYKHLLKYDRVKLVTPFSIKVYSLDELKEDKDILLYLKLKSKQRLLKRLKSKINRINKYYNQPTELWARSFEYYVTRKDYFIEKCPKLTVLYDEINNSGNIPLISNFIKILL